MRWKNMEASNDFNYNAMTAWRFKSCRIWRNGSRYYREKMWMSMLKWFSFIYPPYCVWPSFLVSLETKCNAIRGTRVRSLARSSSPPPRRQKRVSLQFLAQNKSGSGLTGSGRWYVGSDYIPRRNHFLKLTSPLLCSFLFISMVKLCDNAPEYSPRGCRCQFPKF